MNFKFLPYFFEKINDRYLISNMTRDFLYISKDEFNSIYTGKLTNQLLEKLVKLRFIVRDDKDLKEVISSYNYINSGLFYGTHLFIFVLTLDCNLNCLYCQANTSLKKCMMSKEIAQKAIDIALQSPAERITFEFQGGEPLLNYGVLKYIVEYTHAHNHSKTINFSLVTNAQCLTKDILEFLHKNDVHICISLDGPKEIHDYNRPTKSGKSNFDVANYWYTVAKELYSHSKDRVALLPTITTKSLADPKGIVDFYVNSNVSHISIRSLSPFGRASENWTKISYTPEDFIDFYVRCMDYIISLSIEGKTTIRESFTEMILCKILGKQPVNYTDLRSPCGATTGQIAINWNGKAYTCDEGRMMSNIGIELFCIGDVMTDSYKDFINSDSACTVCNSSCIESNPNCSCCVYSSICGICPVYSFFTQNDCVGVPIKQDRCKVLRGIYRYIIDWINDPDEAKRKICHEWIR